MFDREVPGTFNHDIWSMAVDGTGQVNLTNDATTDDRNPALSPFGTQVAFERGALNGQANSESDIWVMNVNGSGQVNLTPNAPALDVGPAWSPDGSKIAFSSERANGLAEIFVMNADGTNVTQLTFNPGFVDDSPTWSPDGTKITFSSGPFDGPGNFDIWEVNANGSGLKQLTADPADDWYPDWSPDGSKIAWTRFQIVPPGQTPHSSLWSMNPDGSDQQLLAPALSLSQQLAASWCPDAEHLAFAGGSEIATGIWTIAAGGTIPTQLTAQNNTDFFPECGG